MMDYDYLLKNKSNLSIFQASEFEISRKNSKLKNISHYPRTFLRNIFT